MGVAKAFNPSVVARTTFVAVKPALSSRTETVHHEHHARCIPTAVSCGSVSLSTTHTGNILLNIALTRHTFQKRFYSSPVTVATGSKSLASPPHNHYTKDLKNYDDLKSRNHAYFMVGATSMVGAMAAKNIVTDYLQNLSASADVLALAKVEVNMASIPEGKNVIVKWKGKPIFIRHRTPDEIAEANSVDINSLLHKQTDAERVKNPEWLVMIGVCTHLGCVPIGEGTIAS